MIPAFNNYPYPSFDSHYLNSLSELEHWIYFIKHAHILATEPKDLAFPLLSQVYDLMDMEKLTNTELLQYSEELIGDFNDVSLSVEDAEVGADSLLSMWPLAQETPPVACELLVFDARAMLFSKVPDFRIKVLQFSDAINKAFTGE